MEHKLFYFYFILITIHPAFDLHCLLQQINENILLCTAFNKKGWLTMKTGKKGILGTLQKGTTAKIARDRYVI
jgi:hypothetical protein